MAKGNKLLLKIFQKEEVKREQSEIDSTFRKVIKEIITAKGPVLQPGNEKESKEKKKADKKAILRGDLLVGRGAEQHFDLQFNTSLAKAIAAKTKEELSEAKQEVDKIKSARKSGTDTTRENAQKRYQIASAIFKMLVKKGENLPIKRSEIYQTVFPFWPSEYRIKAPKEDTLFKLQKKYITEQEKKG